MTRLARPLQLAAFSLAVMAVAPALQAQQTPSPAPTPTPNSADQADIIEGYQAIESAAATRLPSPPRSAASEPATPPQQTPAQNAPNTKANELDQSWRSFQTPRRVTRTSPNTYSYGYGSYPEAENTWGYRNPGHVGRSPEYYPPDDQFQNGGPKNYVAQFDQGPPSTRRSAQLQSESVGVARYNALQGHIDRYGAARFGFGYGMGFGGFGGGLFPY